MNMHNSKLISKIRWSGFIQITSHEEHVSVTSKFSQTEVIHCDRIVWTFTNLFFVFFMTFSTEKSFQRWKANASPRQPSVSLLIWWFRLRERHRISPRNYFAANKLQFEIVWRHASHALFHFVRNFSHTTAFYTFTHRLHMPTTTTEFSSKIQNHERPSPESQNSHSRCEVAWIYHLSRSESNKMWQNEWKR